MNRTYDIAVVGSGFAGSLIAMVARRLGHSVALLEKDKHPRMVIGESSTPLSNLLLEDIADRYDLPQLRPLCKWGSWQDTYPKMACGLKRGFTFYHHQLGGPDAPDPDRLRQLLVAASPHNRIADTHWFRSDFDERLVQEAQEVGVDYFDEVQLQGFVDQGNQVLLDGTKVGLPVIFHAKFVVDATGPRGFLHRALHLPELPFPDYPATQALFTHFSNVNPLEDASDSTVRERHPYPVDDAAVHHIFEGGWIWVLRFNNGITSAGVAATDETFARLHLADGETAWRKLVESIPVLRKQFATATAVNPFKHVKKLSFLSGAISGDKWALLPSAAGFIDPLLSTGFPITLLGISRLADIIESDWGKPSFQSRLKRYATQTTNELLATSQLISGLYVNMGNFPVFTALSLIYFAAASFSETVRRLKKPELAHSFLLHDREGFGTTSSKLLDRAQHLQTEQESTQLIDDILRAIEPIDVAGLCSRKRRSWYPVDANDLIRCAHKVEATHVEIAQMLKSSGFYE